MSGGWFKVWRPLLHSELWLVEPFTRGQAWIDLIGLARFEAGHVRIRGYRIELDRGELAWSQQGLGERWKWSRGKVRRFLNELQNDHQIVQRKNFITTIIQVKNYDLYQSDGTADRTAGRTADGTADGTQKKKGKEGLRKLRTSSWEAAEEILEKSGVSAASSAIVAAKGRGASPDDVLALVAEFGQQTRRVDRRSVIPTRHWRILCLA